MEKHASVFPAPQSISLLELESFSGSSLHHSTQFWVSECVKFRSGDNTRGKKKKRKHRFSNVSHSSILALFLITIYFQNIQRAVPYILPNFCNHIQWGRLGGECLLLLLRKGTLNAAYFTFLI